MSSPSLPAAVAVEVSPTSSGVAGSSVQICDSGGVSLVKWQPGIIYRLTSPSGKSYVGQTSQSFKLRLRRHKQGDGSCRAIKGAFAKYGFENFRQEMLLTGVNPVSLDCLERIAIWLTGSLAPLGYNLTAGGNASRVLSAETRHKISLAKQNPSPETRALISKAVKEQWRDPETREALRTRFATAEYREKRADLAKARWEDPSERERMLKLFQDPEAKKKHSDGLKRAWATPESKAKKSAASKRMWELKGLRKEQATRGREIRNDPVRDSPRREALLAYWANPENRKKRSIQSKLRIAQQKGQHATSNLANTDR